MVSSKSRSEFLRYVPLRLIDHVEDCYRDSDGIWICFDESVSDSFGSATLHCYTVKELREEISRFRVVRI